VFAWYMATASGFVNLATRHTTAKAQN
jgi:hypothetical protein